MCAAPPTFYTHTHPEALQATPYLASLSPSFDAGPMLRAVTTGRAGRLQCGYCTAVPCFDVQRFIYVRLMQGFAIPLPSSPPQCLSFCR